MKRSRHPFQWRAYPTCARLLLGLAVAGPTAVLAAEDQSPSLPSPGMAIPMVTPNITVPGPSLPTFAPPVVAPAGSAASATTPQFNATRRAYELKVAEHRRNRETRTSHADRIEYADALIHLERYDEAIDELYAIEERYAEAYANAHLMSIASELSGNLPAARRWTAAALERDPEAQEGTGWLRLALIEARLKSKEDPTWLQKHSVLHGLPGRSEAELLRAVEVQVLARREFFSERDPVLADLYFQVGVRMVEPEARAKYFALSLEAGQLRRTDIEGQQLIRAQGPATAATH